MKKFTGFLICVSISILTGCGAGDSNRISYSNFFVFGASLSDTGNVFTATSGTDPGTSPSYYLGRWSNGPLWIDNVASSYGRSVNASLLGGTNYAYGGAMTCMISTVPSRVPDMCRQADDYLSYVSNKADFDAMYVIDASAVGNEIIEVLSANVSSTQITTVAPKNVTDILQSLYTAGARHFLIINVPDVGVTPLIQAYGPSAAATATNLSSSFNNALTVALGNFAANHSNAHIKQADINNILSNIESSTYDYGINNITDPCLNSGIACTSPENYLFWDNFHPTKKVGEIIGSYVLGLI